MERGDGVVEGVSPLSGSGLTEGGSGAPRWRTRVSVACVAVLVLVLPLVAATGADADGDEVEILHPSMIPRFVNELTSPPPFWEPTIVTDEAGHVLRHDYRIEMQSFYQQILPPPLPMTPVWGYAGYARDAVTGELLGFVRSSPGASFNATRNIPVEAEWVNGITSPHMFAVDPTLHWADPNGFGMPVPPFLEYPPGYPEAQALVPLVTHLHGGEVASTSDGGPNAWFTWDGIQGSGYATERPTDPNAAVYRYPNTQPVTTLWYHDHALGITRMNVMSGLAGFYLLRDPADPVAPLLPRGKYDMPLVIQDRTFLTDGRMYVEAEGLNVDVHPYWQPEFFGTTIMVNGKVWPNMDVDRGQYRFRVLDGSNARFYTLSFSNLMPFTVIATDGGYLRSPVEVTSLTIAPGERYEILVDFSGLSAGTTVLLKNTAKAPFPRGQAAHGSSIGQIMQFTVTAEAGPALADLPPVLNPTFEDGFPSLAPATKTRILTLIEIMGDEGPLEVVLNGQEWDAPVSEYPTLGTTEEWVIVNPTADTHPIHLHLVQFQLVSRQRIHSAAYERDWEALNGMPPFMFTPEELAVDAYLKGPPLRPSATEQGWKDTVQMHPGQVTIIRVRFAPVDGDPNYVFDATSGPGYVWHCHILEHEDNEMMRPYILEAPTG